MPDLCPGCFEDDRPTGNATCPTCGYSPGQDRLPLSLPIETELKGRYLAGRVLGEPGGFGVTYLGYDRLQGEKVAIKEYMPREMAGRDTDGHSVVPHSGQGSEEFEYGKEQFMEEAQTLARFDHANIVGVRDFFEANGTAYLVMDYYEGKTLDAYLAEVPDGQMAPEAATEVMMRVLDGLKEMHREGYLHRDVKPDNIYLTAEGRPVLIDFGAARQALGERSRSLSVVMTPGYAPYEQYRRDGDQGPHTDVYGAGATLYRMITGQKPPPATDRIVDDTLEAPRRVNPAVPEGLSEAVTGALAPGNKERTSTAEVLQERLRANLSGEERPGTKSVSQDRRTRSSKEPQEKSQGLDETDGAKRTTEPRRSGPEPSRRRRSSQADREVQTLSGHKSQIHSVDFSPDGSLLVIGAGNRETELYSLGTGRKVRNLHGLGHSGATKSVAFSPEGDLVATGGYDDTVGLHEKGTGQKVQTLRGHDGNVHSVAFSPSGNFVATVSQDSEAKLWSVKRGGVIRTHDEHTGPLCSVSFSPSGNLMATGGRDDTVRFWSVETGLTERILRVHTKSVRSIAFSPSGDIAATGSSDNVAKLWSVAETREVSTLRGHDSRVCSVAFSTNGEIIATASADGTAKLWSVQSGEEIRTLQAHEDGVTSVAFSPDDQWLATGSRDKTAKLWPLPTDL